MIGRSAEDPKYARIKEVLSEMIANMNTEAEKEVFNIEDSFDGSSKEDTFTNSPGTGSPYQRSEDNIPLITAGTTGVVSPSSNGTCMPFVWMCVQGIYWYWMCCAPAMYPSRVRYVLVLELDNCGLEMIQFWERKQFGNL